MTRILIFLLWVLLGAFTITVMITQFDSRISGEAFGVRFDSPSWLLISLIILGFLGTIYATHKIKDIMAMPAKLRARQAEARRTRGIAALTRGLEAVDVGDSAGAAHHARVAQNNLDDISLTRLLSARAAEMVGDEAAAAQSFAAMLDAPETEFIGLKGLYAQALKSGDRQKAAGYAERAFALRGNALWAFQSVFDLALENGAWGDAREAVAKAKRNNLITADKADRASAALYAASADAARISGDSALAIKESQAALKLAPSFAPAATIAAQLLSDEGKKGKAANIIETAFARDAHPALIRLYDTLYADAAPDKRAEKLKTLAAKNVDSDEAAMLNARAAIVTQDFETAINTLEPLVTAAPNAHVYALMASAAGGLHGEEVGRGWLERAASAPRDPRPGADGYFHFTHMGWRRIIVEYMEHARLSPPPLEDAGEAITSEELRLLTAPLMSEETPEELAGDILDNSAQEESPPPLPDVEPAIDEDDAETNSAKEDASPEKVSEVEKVIDTDAEGERLAAAARLTP